jgi:hypothetical protein
LALSMNSSFTSAWLVTWVSCLISGFRCEVDENCILLDYYTASSRYSLPTFRDDL